MAPLAPTLTSQQTLLLQRRSTAVRTPSVLACARRSGALSPAARPLQQADFRSCDFMRGGDVRAWHWPAQT